MPRFFFNLSRKGRVIADPEGTDFDQIGEAEREAVLSARDVITRILKNGEPVHLDDSIQVVDEQGSILLTVSFKEAMMASEIGTWRYTLADNICTYDDNAQRLYGLSEPSILHDAAGTRAKFHPDDMARMWARVAEALDPTGDGRYEVEYRVKQLDGSWRWLSAWGLVEFTGQGPTRKPIAIAGASRDLTELKQTEELHQLLFNELNHRVDNTSTIVQSVVIQSLQGAADLKSARKALDARIGTLARIHDLLTDGDWLGADVLDLVARVIFPFPVGQILVDGPSVYVSPKQALALSLAIHELAANAAQFGALSRSEGRVELRWKAQAGKLHLSWDECGGPQVVSPPRRGFGSRLLMNGFCADLDGQTWLEFAASGVRCRMTAALATPS